MNFGGAFLSSKNASLQKLPEKWIPKTVSANPNEDFFNLECKIENEGITYPFIVKPDMGERGKGVEIIRQSYELKAYLLQYSQESILIQEYIDYPIELGILFYWDLHGNPKISSIGKKSFCSVIGNGKDSLKTIIKNNPRLVNRISVLREKFKLEWETIIPKGKKLLIEPIGNHNRGTVFRDGRAHFSDELLQWVANCAKHIPDFDYGRFDIKIQNWDAFKTDKGIKIMEINGVNSEPIHIYDPSYSIWNAYRDIFHQMHVIFQLSQQKLIKKEQTQSLFEFIRSSQLVLNRKT